MSHKHQQPQAPQPTSEAPKFVEVKKTIVIFHEVEDIVKIMKDAFARAFPGTVTHALTRSHLPVSALIGGANLFIVQVTHPRAKELARAARESGTPLIVTGHYPEDSHQAAEWGAVYLKMPFGLGDVLDAVGGPLGFAKPPLGWLRRGHEHSVPIQRTHEPK